MKTILVSACVSSIVFAADLALVDSAKAVFKPLSKQFDSAANPVTPAKVELGRQLYFETRLSKNHDVSCNTCHGLDTFGVDGKPTSTGHKKQLGGRNSPTVYNAGIHLAQFWDGRAATLEDQAKGPILNPIEMAMPQADSAVAVLKSIPGYAPMFKKAFPKEKDPITYDNLAKAIGGFERTLSTPSRFDKFLKGDSKALTDAEQNGLKTFMSIGCTACHMGEGIGGAMYQKLGLVKPVKGLKDLGRFEATKVETDKYFFKVPSLRNIEKTGPYLHDGSLKTLEETTAFMAEYQLGKTLSSDETASIVTFLKSLTGEVSKNALKVPKVLPAGPSTPKPDPS